MSRDGNGERGAGNGGWGHQLSPLRAPRAAGAGRGQGKRRRRRETRFDAHPALGCGARRVEFPTGASPLLPQDAFSSGSSRDEHPGILCPTQGSRSSAPAVWGGGSAGSAGAQRLHAGYTRVTRGLHSPCFPERPSNPSAPNYPSRQLTAPSPGAAPSPGTAPRARLLQGSHQDLGLDVPGEGTGKEWQQHRGHPGGHGTSLAAPGARSPLAQPQNLQPGSPCASRSASLDKSGVSNPCPSLAAFQTPQQLQRFPDANVIPKRRAGDGRGWQRHPKNPSRAPGENSPGKAWKNSPRGAESRRVTAVTAETVSQPR